MGKPLRAKDPESPDLPFPLWCYPRRAKTMHYFTHEGFSLCGTHWFSREPYTFQSHDRSAGGCKVCRRAYEELKRYKEVMEAQNAAK